MLKRKDLAKEFELVVQQEIKNYNDTVLSTNMSLNKCNQKLDELARDIERKFAEQENKILEKEYKSTLQRERGEDSISQIIMNLSELQSKIISYSEDLIHLRQDSKEVYATKEDLFKSINQIGNNLKELNLKILHIKDEFTHQIRLISRDFKEEFERFKKELLDKPSEAKQVKQDLEKKIESASIDAECVLKELRIYKKDSVIIEKKIENIYTLIERINKRISECPKQA